jgi:hypothetical protein
MKAQKPQPKTSKMDRASPAPGKKIAAKAKVRKAPRSDDDREKAARYSKVWLSSLLAAKAKGFPTPIY